MNVWLTIPSLEKKAGGPATVVQHLSEQLATDGTSVTVVAGTGVPGASQVFPRDTRVRVLSVSGRNELRLAVERSLTAGEHIIHDFGIWLPANHAVVSVSQELGVPLVISPCGMLAPWALKHRAWKKRLAWWLYQRRDLFRARLLVATAAPEAQDLQRLIPGKQVALVANGVDLPEAGLECQDAKPQGRTRTAAFLGRLHPVKGLRNLVEAWQRVRPRGWCCVLAGPDEVEHKAELQALLRRYQLENEFQFPGLLDDDQKWELLRKSDLFVLPSFTENFGIAAAEAMAAGLPVIATKGTPWEELQSHRCGWWVDLGVEPLEAALREAVSLSDRMRFEMGQRGRQLVEEKYSWSRVGKAMLSAYASVLEKRKQLGCGLPTSARSNGPLHAS